MDELSRLPERSGRCAGGVETRPALALTAGCADHYGALAEVKACFISLTQLAGVCLGLGIQVGDPGHLDEFFLRLLEARDSDAGPAFAPGPLLFVRCGRVRSCAAPAVLYRFLGVCGLQLAPLGVIEC